MGVLCQLTPFWCLLGAIITQNDAAGYSVLAHFWAADPGKYGAHEYLQNIPDETRVIRVSPGWPKDGGVCLLADHKNRKRTRYR